jgi:hypothetical protein
MRTAPRFTPTSSGADIDWPAEIVSGMAVNAIGF